MCVFRLKVTQSRARALWSSINFYGGELDRLVVVSIIFAKGPWGYTEAVTTVYEERYLARTRKADEKIDFLVPLREKFYLYEACFVFLPPIFAFIFVFFFFFFFTDFARAGPAPFAFDATARRCLFDFFSIHRHFSR